MPRKSMPAGWVNYSDLKGSIAGTRIIPFKTPLKESVFLNRSMTTKWTPEEVLYKIPNLGLIVNLCFAQMPYYYVDEFKQKGVCYEGIPCAGQAIPDPTVVDQFANCVKNFESDLKNNGKLIGVHCTHGVNRTGYVVCRYLIDYLNFEPEKAIQEFENARGHAIERKEYIDALKNISAM